MKTKCTIILTSLISVWNLSSFAKLYQSHISGVMDFCISLLHTVVPTAKLRSLMCVLRRYRDTVVIQQPAYRKHSTWQWDADNQTWGCQMLQVPAVVQLCKKAKITFTDSRTGSFYRHPFQSLRHQYHRSCRWLGQQLSTHGADFSDSRWISQKKKKFYGPICSTRFNQSQFSIDFLQRSGGRKWCRHCLGFLTDVGAGYQNTIDNTADPFTHT